MAITILLVDDHQIVRQGLHALLQLEPDMQVVGECGNGLDAIQMINHLHPDVTVLDLMMPGLNGLEVIRQVSEATKVIVLSMHENEAYVLQALRGGAMGYILKDSTAEDLVQAIQAVVQGRRYLSARLSERAIEAYFKKSKTSSLDPYETLTTREREVLQFVAQGLSNPEISERLSISPRTVEIHRANMLRKLDIHNQSELIRYALRKGIISP